MPIPLDNRAASNCGPDFVVIGAGKSGTTSLHQYLVQHCHIYMAHIKEPRFFCLDENGRYPDLGESAPRRLVKNFEGKSISTWEEYCGLFKDAQTFQIKGEISPQYIYTERSAAKIYEYIPDARLIAVLRHPVEIAYSAFMMNIRNGYETEKYFESAVPVHVASSRKNWRWKLYIEQGLHGRNLENFYSIFPREQVKVILFEDFVASPKSAVETICEFLGLENDNQIRFKEKYNVGYEPRLHPSTRQLIKKIFPVSVRNRIRATVNRMDRKKVVMPSCLYGKYLPVYREDILLLQSLLQTDLSDWLEPVSRN